eukprot:scaffold1581_cov342-Prasinococcus_capsulatus_cf.AAC.1
MEAEEAQLEAVKALPSLEGKKGTWHLYIHKLRCWLPRELSEEEAAKAGGSKPPYILRRSFVHLRTSRRGGLHVLSLPAVVESGRLLVSCRWRGSGGGGAALPAVGLRFRGQHTVLRAAQGGGRGRHEGLRPEPSLHRRGPLAGEGDRLSLPGTSAEATVTTCTEVRGPPEQSGDTSLRPRDVVV